MTPYKPPLDEIRFTLQRIAGLEAIARLPGCEAATPDLVDQVLEEAGRFAANELAPLNAAGDRERARLDDGAVRTPKGFKEAYRKFVEGGWHGLPFPEEWGGQGLPWTRRDPGVGDVAQRQLRVLPVPDPDPGRGRAAAAVRHRRAAGALSAQAGQRRVGGHHVPDRAACRLRRRRAQDPGGARGRPLPHPRHQDLHHLRRARLHRRTSSTWCWRARRTRRPARAASRCS